MYVCTAVAKRELARARLLADSLAGHHPEARFCALVVDDVAGAVRHEDFATLRPEDLGVEGLELLYQGCGPRTLALALRPWLLARLLSDPDSGRLVVWLCPEARVYAPLDELEALCAGHGIVATSQGDRLLALAEGQPARRFIDAWAERVREGTARLGASLNGLVLERELDRLRDAEPASSIADLLSRPPSDQLRSAHLLTGAGWNADPETLATGPLEVNGAGVAVATERLRVFDFRGVDAAGDGALADLAGEYATTLERHGHSKLSKTPYGHGVLARNDKLGQRLRRALIEAAGPDGVSASLLTERGTEQFLDWLREPAPEGGSAGVNRFHYGLYRDHSWMRRSFPHLEGGDAPRLLRYLREEGYQDVPIPEDLLPERVSALPPMRLVGTSRAAAARDRTRGVNLVGFLHAEFGLGEAARLLIKGLDARKVPVLPLDAPLAHLTRQETEFVALPAWSDGFPVNLLCVNGNLIPGLVEDVGPELFRDRHTIAMWFWETSRLPEDWVPAFEYLDEIWVASRFMAEVIESVSPVPVRAVPLPMSLPPTVPFDRTAYGIPEDDYLFLFVFDWHSAPGRKNPLAVIEAFTEAFPPGSGASLLLKSMQGDEFLPETEQVDLAASRHPGIHVVDRHLSWREKNSMIAGCDCYVSLHRSEGLGLTLAEAMWFGKPTIATAYGGNLEFMTPENSRLVNYTMTPVGEGVPYYPADAMWADPDPAAAAEAMRWAFENRDQAAEMARRGSRDIRRAHAPEVAGEELERALAPAWERAAAGATRDGRPEPGPETAPSQEAGREPAETARGLLWLDPVPERPGARWPRRWARRLLSRLLRPYTSYQRQVDQSIVDSLDQVVQRLAELDARLAETRAEPALERAALLAELRRVSDLVEQETGALRSEVSKLPERGD